VHMHFLIHHHDRAQERWGDRWRLLSNHLRHGMRIANFDYRKLITYYYIPYYCRIASNNFLTVILLLAMEPSLTYGDTDTPTQTTRLQIKLK